MVGTTDKQNKKGKKTQEEKAQAADDHKADGEKKTSSNPQTPKQ